MPEITRYTAAQSAEWNEFVERSKNGTFLFHRSYMDYHADRFTDHSLMVWNKGRLSALLPANEHDGTLYSHQGLTYGGLITNQLYTKLSLGLTIYCQPRKTSMLLPMYVMLISW